MSDAETLTRVKELHLAARALLAAEPGHLLAARARLHLDAVRVALVDGALPETLAGRLGPEGARLVGEALLQGPEGATADHVTALEAAHALVLADLDPQATAAARAQERRWILGGVAVLVCLLAVWGVARLVDVVRRPVDLARGKPWTTSSSYTPCHPDENQCGVEKTRIFFVTNEEMGPWYQVDLGQVTAFSKLTVVNRTDMLMDRAIPLIAEVSDDAQTWREVARKKDVFFRWDADLGPQHARYLRLRVERFTALHLEAVEVHP